MKENPTFDQLPEAVNQLDSKLDNIERLLLRQNEQKLSVLQDKLVTIQEAANFLSLSVPTIYSKVSKGELPVMKRTKRLYFSLQELTEYLKAGRKKCNSEIEAEANSYLNEKGRK